VSIENEVLFQTGSQQKWQLKWWYVGWNWTFPAADELCHDACRWNWHQLYIFVTHGVGVMCCMVANSQSSFCLWFLRSACKALGHSMVSVEFCDFEHWVYASCLWHMEFYAALSPQHSSSYWEIAQKMWCCKLSWGLQEPQRGLHVLWLIAEVHWANLYLASALANWRLLTLKAKVNVKWCVCYM